MAIQFSNPTNPNNFFNRGLRSARDFLSQARQRNVARQPAIPQSGLDIPSTPAVGAGFNYQPPKFGGGLTIPNFVGQTAMPSPADTKSIFQRFGAETPSPAIAPSRAGLGELPISQSLPQFMAPPAPVTSVTPVSPDLTPAPTPITPPPPTGQVPPQGAPVLPQIPPTAEQIQQAIPQTSAAPSGIAAPLTGGATSGAAGAGAGIQTPLAGGLDPATKKAIEDAEKAVQEANKISAEELTSQEDLDKLQEATRRAYRSTQDQPIPLEFITGQLASLERRALGLAEPLETKLARLQAKRTATLAGSKFALERLDKEAERQRGEEFTLGEGQVRFRGGREVARGPAKSEAAKAVTLGAGEQLIDPTTGKVIASGGPKAPSEAAQMKAADKEEAKQIATRRTLNQANTAITNIDNALNLIKEVPFGGIGRTIGSVLPSTDARDLAKTIETVQALIGFGALEEMRKASPTGGALGQVSERELSFLQATIGSLDVGQSTEVLKERLNQVRNSFATLKGLSIAESGVEVPVVVTNPNTRETIEVTASKEEITALMAEGNTIKFL